MTVTTDFVVLAMAETPRPYSSQGELEGRV